MSDTCRICFEDDNIQNFIVPCRCKGSQKYVHPKCLFKWQNTNISNYIKSPEIYSKFKIMYCPECRSKYKYFSDNPKWNTLGKNVHQTKSSPCMNWIWLVICLSFWFLLLAIWCKGIRPIFYIAEGGIKIGFIRVGDPVPGLHAGIILEATSVMARGIFYKSRILITKYSANEGAMGFILNKPQKESFPEKFYVGGPVEPNSVYVLHSNPDIENCEMISEGIYFGGEVSSKSDNMKLKIFFGYSGWSPLQLDGEIRAGVWKIDGNLTSEDLFKD